jgi:uncharacterized protein DUF1835
METGGLVQAEHASAVGTLHVTNGDSAAQTLRATGVGGAVVCWRDVLNEGPLPALSRERLRELRARFLADCGWGTAAAVVAELRDRDERLDAALAGDGGVALWFEHDLYDQLQILQALAQIAEAGADIARVEMIVVGAFEGRPDFHGLGELTAPELASLWPARRALGEDVVELALRAWDAVRAPEPTAVEALLERDTSALPFLAGALRRLLEELPGARDGLSRSERQVLGLLARGPQTALELFAGAQRFEEAPFEGDTWAFRRIAQLCAGERPLVAAVGPEPPQPRRGDLRAVARATFAITEDGRDVLAGTADRVDLLRIDRWLGGTHLRPGRVWRFDDRAGRVLAPPA